MKDIKRFLRLFQTCWEEGRIRREREEKGRKKKRKGGESNYKEVEAVEEMRKF